MSVAMAAYQMSFVEQSFYYFGVKLVKFAGKEEASFDTVPFQGADNGIRAVSLVGCCEYEADLFFRRVGTHDTAIDVYIFVCRCTCLFHAFFLHGREIIGEAGGSVHSRFIGGIVVECIMVYHQLRLKAFVILSGRAGNAGHVYPSQPLEYAAVYGAVHQSACRIAYACIKQGGVGLRRIIAVKRKFHNHARSPRIAAEQPVAEGGFHFGISFIVGCLAVETALRQHGSSQVVGTPDVGNTVQERTFDCFLVCALNTGAHVADELFADARVVYSGQVVVSHVHERIPLVMAGAVGTHPRSDGLAASVFEGLRQVFRLAGSIV